MAILRVDCSCASRPGAAHLFLHDGVALCAEPVDSHLHDVPWLEIPRWLRAVSHTRRGSARDHVTDTEGHEAAQVGNELANGKHHVFRMPVLPTVTVDRGPQRERLRVGDLVDGHEPWPDGRERVCALPLGGAAAMLHLERAFRDIVHEA